MQRGTVLIKSYSMLYEDAMDMFMLYSISPELTCTCDEFHECQQCNEENKNQINNHLKPNQDETN